jgi:hypothetical protein
VSGAVSTVQAYTGVEAPTLVVWRAACAVEADFTGIAAVSVAVGHARHGHGPVAVGARHCAVGRVVSQVARGPAGNLGCVGGEGGGRVELVGEGAVRQVLWWGVLLVVVGCVGQIRVWLARGCKGRHGSSARWHHGTRAVQGRRFGGSRRRAGIRGKRLSDITCSPAAAATAHG